MINDSLDVLPFPCAFFLANLPLFALGMLFEKERGNHMPRK